jgi:hypothetical protein
MTCMELLHCYECGICAHLRNCDLLNGGSLFFLVFSFKVAQFHHVGMDACCGGAPDIIHSVSLSLSEFVNSPCVVRRYWFQYEFCSKFVLH